MPLIKTRHVSTAYSASQQGRRSEPIAYLVKCHKPDCSEWRDMDPWRGFAFRAQCKGEPLAASDCEASF